MLTATAGSDVMLLELVEKALKSAKWPTEVRVSAEAFFYTEDNDRYVEILKPSPSLEKADPFDDTQPGEMCVDPGPAEAEDLGYLAEGTGSPTHSWSQAEASRYTSGPRSGSLEPGEPTPSMSPLGDSESASATARGSEPGKPTQPISPSGDTTEAASSSESGPAQAKRRRLE
ncbi:hypothetical protein GE09DRAFT_143913 [Coniochaeta sp. 2T2.1]|nr:hypothetical protein GE09DRAFT_143913 [Coniochaeta sp. 2T2.1]